MTCEVCDQEGELIVMHGFRLHRECAPIPWREDHDKMERFMAKVMALAPTRAERWKKRERDDRVR